MLINAGTFLAQLDLLRTCAITGGKGTGKDLLAFELSRYYLDQGFKFSTNQNSVWNDPLFTIKRLSFDEWQKIVSNYKIDTKGVYSEVPQAVDFMKLFFNDDTPNVKKRYYTEKELNDLAVVYGKDDDGYFVRVPDMKRRVMVLSEGGRYLRKWAYFENLFEFTRKTDNYIFIPSIRLPHVDLCELVCINVFPLKLIFGIPGGLFYWYVSGAGLAKPIFGLFFHYPTDIGVYDTNDLSTSPTESIEWFTRQIDDIQKTGYGRDGIQAMVSQSSTTEQDDLATYARQIERASLSLPDKRK